MVMQTGIWRAMWDMMEGGSIWGWVGTTALHFQAAGSLVKNESRIWT